MNHNAVISAARTLMVAAAMLRLRSHATRSSKPNVSVATAAFRTATASSPPTEYAA
jgi:hypothetical protein